MILNLTIKKYIYAGKISKNMILRDDIEIVIDDYNRVIVRNNLRYSIEAKENAEISYEIVRADLTMEQAKQIKDIADKIKESGFYNVEEYNSLPIPDKMHYYTISINGEDFVSQTNDINISNVLNIVRAEEVRKKAREMYNTLIG